jgi:hypothetical protein
MDLESGGRCACAQTIKTPRRSMMLRRSEVVAVMDPGSNGVVTNALPAATAPSTQHLASAPPRPPSGGLSSAGKECADRRAPRFEQSVAVQQARWSRLAVIAGLVIGIAGNIAWH